MSLISLVFSLRHLTMLTLALYKRVPKRAILLPPDRAGRRPRVIAVYCRYSSADSDLPSANKQLAISHDDFRRSEDDTLADLIHNLKQ